LDNKVFDTTDARCNHEDWYTYIVLSRFLIKFRPSHTFEVTALVTEMYVCNFIY